MRTLVYDFIEFDCYLFLDNPPIAQGFSDLKGTYSDLNGVGEEVKANAWGWSAHGVLTDGYGEEDNFSSFVINIL